MRQSLKSESLISEGTNGLFPAYNGRSSPGGPSHERASSYYPNHVIPGPAFRMVQGRPRSSRQIAAWPGAGRASSESGSGRQRVGYVGRFASVAGDVNTPGELFTNISHGGTRIESLSGHNRNLVPVITALPSAITGD